MRKLFVVLLFMLASVAGAEQIKYTAPVPTAAPIAGSNTQFIYNNGGVYAGTTACTYNNGTNAATCSGAFYLSALELTVGTMTQERLAGPRTALTSWQWTNAMVAALPSTAGDIKVATLPTKFMVEKVLVVTQTAAVGPTTVTVACGRTSATYIDYVVASDAKAVSLYGDASGERGTNQTGYDIPSYGGGATDIFCHFVSTGANLSTVTGSTGRVIIIATLLP